MEYELNSFAKHIPPETLSNNNDNLKMFVELLDGMLRIREDELESYMRSFYYPANTSGNLIKRYLDEWGAEYLVVENIKNLDCLYQNYQYIYYGKGTYFALKTMLKCLFKVDETTEVTISDLVLGKPIILTDDYQFLDWLPSGQDIANEVVNTGSDKVWCPTLLGGSWLPHHSTLTITVTNTQIVGYSDEFLKYIKQIIINYLPMANSDFIDITINIL